MGRIVEAQRIPTVDAILGHYTEAEVVNGGPILVAVGVGYSLQGITANQVNKFRT